jgi:hypothetical protein
VTNTRIALLPEAPPAEQYVRRLEQAFESNPSKSLKPRIEVCYDVIDDAADNGGLSLEDYNHLSKRITRIADWLIDNDHW